MLINAAAFYGDRNIKVGHSIFHAFFKKYILYSISPFRSNIAENIFLNGFLLSEINLRTASFSYEKRSNRIE